MDKQKECDIKGHLERVSTKKEAEEQFHLMVRERTRINKELDQQKADEHKINQKLRWFSDLDKNIEWKMWEIKNLEYSLGKVDLGVPNLVQIQSGFLRLPGKDDQTQLVRPDRKRCKKRLIRKGKMNIEYLEEVHEEHLLSMKSSEITYFGTQELNDMIQSMVKRIQHGNKKRADEMKMYQELWKFKETKESFIAPEPQIPYYWSSRVTQRAKEYERSMHLRKIILLDDLEKLKRERVEGKSKVRRLKADLEHVRRNISYSNKELEIVELKKYEAFKLLYY